MDIVFYQEVFFSFGERQQAVSFAAELEKAGYRAHFVVSDRIAKATRLAGFEPRPFSTPAMGAEIVRRIDPALVIACELFNLTAESIRELVATGKPLATLDGTTLGVEIRTDPFGDAEFRDTLELPEHFYSFRPCPANDPAADTDRVFHWRLFPDMTRIERDRATYHRLGLDPDRKTVMLAVAPWAQYFASLPGPTFDGLAGYYDKLLNRITDGLDAWGEPLQLLLVMKSQPGTSRRGNVAVHIPGLLHYDVYDHMLRTCDVLLSDNVIQASLSKAIVMGTPHLMIQNMSPSELPYRFNIFPLRRIFDPQSAFGGIVECAEYGDPHEIRTKLVSVLETGYHDGPTRDRRMAYLDSCRSLAEPGEILERIVGPARSV